MSGPRRYFSDALGSITALSQQNTTTTSTLTSTSEYDAWGNNLNTIGFSNNSIGYTGQRVDGADDTNHPFDNCFRG